jgi:uncharacterized membrane protein YeaQ/YmgE (transglycosylase-associated protein family)
MSYSLESLLIFLAIGLIAGWLAGVFFKGSGFGVLGDIVLGVIGAEIGGWMFGRLGISTYSFIGAVVTAFVGALALLIAIKLIRSIGSVRST